MFAIKRIAGRVRRPSLRSLMLLVALVAVSIVAVPKGLKLKRARDRRLLASRFFTGMGQHVRNSRDREPDPLVKEWASEVERFYLTAGERHLQAAAKPWGEEPQIPPMPVASKEQRKALAYRRREIERGSRPQILIDELIQPRGNTP